MKLTRRKKPFLGPRYNLTSRSLSKSIWRGTEMLPNIRSIFRWILIIDMEKRGIDRTRYGPEIGLETTVLRLSLSSSAPPSFHLLALFQPLVAERVRCDFPAATYMPPAYTYIRARVVRERPVPFQLSIYLRSNRGWRESARNVAGVEDGEERKRKREAAVAAAATTRRILDKVRRATIIARANATEYDSRRFKHFKRMRAVRFLHRQWREWARSLIIFTLFPIRCSKHLFDSKMYLNHRKFSATRLKRSRRKRVIIAKRWTAKKMCKNTLEEKQTEFERGNYPRE